MTWFSFAFLTALAVATHDAWMKKWFSHLSPWEMTAYPLAFSLPLFTASFLFIDTPPLDRVFYITFAVCLPLNAIPLFMYMKAIRISPLSLTVPYLAFTPVFIVGTGWLFLNEIPDGWGLAGIAAVCVGSYVLNIDPAQPSFLAPFCAVFRETGSWMMLIVALIYSVTSVLGKLAILHSSAMFFQMSFYLVLNTLMIVSFLILRKIQPAVFAKHPAKGAVVGLLFFFHILFHGFGISMAKAAYMISVKRLSIVLGVIFGGMVFHEPNFRMRLLGAVLMFSGAAGIVLMAR